MQESLLKPELYLLEQSMTQKCRDCGRILAGGKFTIGLSLDDGAGKIIKYMLGASPEPKCCGRARNVFLAFATEAEAEAEIAKVREHLNMQGTTEGLTLLSCIRPELN